MPVAPDAAVSSSRTSIMPHSAVNHFIFLYLLLCYMAEQHMHKIR